MTGRIDRIENPAGDGDLFIEGVLDDGTVDSGGMRVDPAWLLAAATDWLRNGGSINTDPYHPVGVATGISRAGDTVRIRARIFDPDGKAGVAKGAAISMSIARPTVIRHNTAPMGVINGGQLLSVWLTRAIQRSDDSQRTHDQDRRDSQRHHGQDPNDRHGHNDPPEQAKQET
jgi:hypothetical protein